MMRCLVICCALFALGRSLGISRLQTGSLRAPIQTLEVHSVSPSEAVGLPQAFQTPEQLAQSVDAMKKPAAVLVAGADAEQTEDEPDAVTNNSAEAQGAASTLSVSGTTFVPSAVKDRVAAEKAEQQRVWREQTARRDARKGLTFAFQRVPELQNKEVVVMDVANIGWNWDLGWYPGGFDTFAQRINLAIRYYEVRRERLAVILVLGPGFLEHGRENAIKANKWIERMKVRLGGFVRTELPDGLASVNSASHICRNGIIHIPKHRAVRVAPDFKDDNDDRDVLEYAAAYDCEIVSNDRYNDFLPPNDQRVRNQRSPFDCLTDDTKAWFIDNNTEKHTAFFDKSWTNGDFEVVGRNDRRCKQG